MRRPKATALGFIPVALFIALAGTPGEAEASHNCTSSYLTCLNWGLMQGSPVEELRSVECAAGWLGCTVSKLRWW